MSSDEFSTKQKKRLVQYLFWTGVAVIGGYIILYVV
jgi:hypothetical protein